MKIPIPFRRAKAPERPTVIVNRIDLLQGSAGFEMEDAAETASQQYRYFTGWVYKGASFIAQSEAMQVRKFAVLQTNSKGELETVDDHDVRRLMRQPNAWMSGFDLMEYLALCQEVTGTAYWFLEFGGPRPTGILPIPPHLITPVPDKTGQQPLSHYRYDTGRGRTIDIDPRQIIAFPRPHPKSWLAGFSAVRAGILEIQADREAHQYKKEYMKNAPRPGAFFTTTEDPDPEERKELLQQIKEQYGGPKNAGNSFLGWGGLTMQPVPLPPEDAELLLQMKFGRDEILALFPVPGSKLGIAEDVNRANAEAADWGFMKDTIAPRLVSVAEKITAQLLLPFWGEGLSCEFKDLIPSNPTEENARFDLGAKYSALTINEMRHIYFGLPPVDWGDVPWTAQFGMVSAAKALNEMGLLPAEQRFFLEGGHETSP